MGRLERRDLPLLEATVSAPSTTGGVGVGVFELQAGRGFSGTGWSPTANAKDLVYDAGVEPSDGARLRWVRR